MTRRPGSAPSARAKSATIALRRGALPALRRLRPTAYTDSDPYRVLDIPTPLITHMQDRWNGRVDLPWLESGPRGRWSSLRRRWHAGIVLDGDWDRATTAFDDYHLTRVLTERFVHGRDWTDVRYVAKALDKVARGELAWGGRCQTADDVHARCAYLDALHTSLSAEGYRDDRAPPAVGGDFTHFLVNIGRCGRIIRNNDGKHRIVLARVIGLPSLRARVLVRHREWQRVRDHVRRGGRPGADIESHPDLTDLR